MRNEKETGFCLIHSLVGASGFCTSAERAGILGFPFLINEAAHISNEVSECREILNSF